MLSAATLSIFNHLFASVAEEMGTTLAQAAYSINIKERLDFSCALFTADGRLLAQAAHIPVHLGAMPASVQAALHRCSPFSPGDIVILNDPYLGGNHLPDITLVSPIFLTNDTQTPQFFAASRAHHADIGGMSPGSMPLSREIFQEGLIIPPIKLIAAGVRNDAVWQLLLRNVRTPQERDGDLAAQIAAQEAATRRLYGLSAQYGADYLQQQAEALIRYGENLMQTAISMIPNGEYRFTDYLDNDGQSEHPVPIQLVLTVADRTLLLDFTGTAPAVEGNLNCVPAIVTAAAAYCLRCVALALLQAELPLNHGMLMPCQINLPAGSLLDPFPPHAVAAGNVETSQRIVDVIFGALAQALPELIPAASQGTMNNLAFGGIDPVTGLPFAYYETMGGGVGGGPEAAGSSAVHSHMSNTLNTPIEAIEYQFPVRIIAYEIRQGSGGAGKHAGGDGLRRQIQFLVPVQATLTTERRERPPYGLRGGKPGQVGKNGRWLQSVHAQLSGKVTMRLAADEMLEIETPGGGGWGSPEQS